MALLSRIASGTRRRVAIFLCQRKGGLRGKEVVGKRSNSTFNVATFCAIGSKQLGPGQELHMANIVKSLAKRKNFHRRLLR